MGKLLRVRTKPFDECVVFQGDAFTGVTMPTLIRSRLCDRMRWCLDLVSNIRHTSNDGSTTYFFTNADFEEVCQIIDEAGGDIVVISYEIWFFFSDKTTPPAFVEIPAPYARPHMDFDVGGSAVSDSTRDVVVYPPKRTPLGPVFDKADGGWEVPLE